MQHAIAPYQMLGYSDIHAYYYYYIIIIAFVYAYQEGLQAYMCVRLLFLLLSLLHAYMHTKRANFPIRRLNAATLTASVEVKPAMVLRAPDPRQ